MSVQDARLVIVSSEDGSFDGEIFQRATRGTASATRIWDPNVLKRMNACVSGNTMDSAGINPASHWIDGSVAWCPVVKKCEAPSKPKAIGPIGDT